MAARKYHIEMSDLEIELFSSILRESEFVLEFGSGGSSILAVECSVTKLISVESDREWIEKISDQVNHINLSTEINFFFADIGPTKEWGYPVDKCSISKWPNYWGKVWEAYPDLSNVDCILIDGRFRVACALNALLYASDDALIVIHDFNNRSFYSEILKLTKVIKSIDTLVVLKKIKTISKNVLLEKIETFSHDYR